jgi:hypothetical protein
MADWKNWTDQFRGSRYHKTTTGVTPGGMPVIEVDPSNPYAASDGRGMQISFYHVPTQRAVYFKAFITAFNETFSSDWASETVYGRTDPIYLFKNTQRQITLSFKVPAFSEGEAYENLGRVQKLTQYLYPSYIDSNGAKLIGQSPLIRMKVMNLAASPDGAGAHDNVWLGSSDEAQAVHAANTREMATTMSGSQLYDNYRSTGRANQGLLGVLSSVQINHNLEQEGVLEKGHNTILPKLIDVAVSFNVIHEHTLGWDQQGNALSPSFPYGVVLEEFADDPTNAAASYDEKVERAQAAQLDKDLRQQATDNAEARYSGMFGTSGFLGIGGGRAGRDLRRAEKGKLNSYEASALAGAVGYDHAEEHIEAWTANSKKK